MALPKIETTISRTKDGPMKTSYKVILCLLLLASLKSFGQFDDMRSDTDFDTSKAPAKNIENKPTRSQPKPINVNNVTTQADTSGQTDLFGSRPQRGKEPEGANPQKSKYVHLNPETGYGPEIIESFDFPNSTLEEVTKHIQKLTGLNLMIATDLRGKVNISAPTPITVGDAWKAYLAALNMNQYTIVKAGAFYKIISLKDVRSTPTPIYTGEYTPDSERFVMKVIKLNHIDAKEVQSSFRMFMTSQGRITPLDQTNTIIASDVATNINRLVKLIEFLDVPGYQESMHIIQVHHTQADEIAKLLQEIIDSSGGSSTTRRTSTRRFSRSSSDDKKNISKIIAEPRTNSIIAMANAAGAKELKDLIQKLDRKVEASGSDRIHVYYLKHSNAEDLEKTLNSLLSGASSSSSSRSSNTRSTFTRRTTTGENQSADIFNGEVKIASDKSNNAIIITASSSDWETMEKVINKLDIPQDQVMVEGMIIETSADKTRELGASIATATGLSNTARAGFNANNADFATLAQTGLPISIGGLFAGLGFGKTRTITYGGQEVKVSSVSGLIKLLVTDQTNNVLATPRILIVNNGEGSFEAGSTVPIPVTNTNTNGTSTASETSQKALLKFTIKPQINKESRMVKMDINIASTDFDSSTNVAANVSGKATRERAAVTQAIVKDGDTVVMGGLLQDKIDVQKTKVPLLGDIPVLGWLFRSKSKRVTKTNVLFFLSPKIISPYDPMATSITQETLDQYNQNMKKDFKEEDIPFKEEVKKLGEKLEKQKQGDLFDTAKSGPVTKDELDILPMEYDDIIEEIKE